MAKGNINVAVENIFPLIKKFLYSDHEIFLRELISNATDATLKLKHIANVSDAKVEYGNPQIEVKIDKKKKRLHIIDQGLGMTAEEVKKYINEIAFSGAEEFLDQYKDKAGKLRDAAYDLERLGKENAELRVEKEQLIGFGDRLIEEKYELEEQRDEARDQANKYHRLYQGTLEEILLFQESESYSAKRARDLIAELKEAQKHLAETHALAREYHKLYLERLNGDQTD